MIIDLTHTLKTGISVYPDSPEPVFTESATFEQQGWSEIHISMCTHVGTHIDAPSHMIPGAKSLDKFELDKFIGSAMVINCSGLPEITKNFLSEYEKQITSVDFVLFYTGWQHKWSTPEYLSFFPTLTCEAAQWLAVFNLKGIGFDNLSVDAIGNEQPNHITFLEEEILIIENLTNLDMLIGKKFELTCLPLKIENSDGSPVRAFANIPLPLMR